MNWYYLQGETATGPVSEEDLVGLLVEGTISRETLICREGSEEWRGYADEFENCPATSSAGVLIAEESGTIKFECPHCRQHIATEKALADQRVECPTCGGDFMVPTVLRQEAPEIILNDEPVATPRVTLTHKARQAAKDSYKAVKRRSEEAALKARIEKLKNVDLRRAYHALGKKCYDEELLTEELKNEFGEIRALDEEIARKQTHEEAGSDETKIDKVKRGAKDAAKAGHAQVLLIQRKRVMTKLGKLVFTYSDASTDKQAGAERAQIANTLDRIRQLEAQARFISLEISTDPTDRKWIVAGGALATLVVVAILLSSLVVWRRDKSTAAAQKGGGLDNPNLPSIVEQHFKPDPQYGVETRSGDLDNSVPLAVPPVFPPSNRWKITLNNIKSPESIQWGNNSSSPASRDLCEVYFRAYYFINAHVAFLEADTPGLPRIDGKLTPSATKLLYIAWIGATDRNRKLLPRWHPDDQMPELTRRVIYEQYYGFPLTPDHVRRARASYDFSRPDEAGFLDLTHDPPITANALAAYLAAFDVFKAKYLRKPIPEQPGSPIWEAWMQQPPADLFD